MLLLHTLTGSSLRNILKLYKTHPPSLYYLHRSLYIATYAAFAVPFRLLEKKNHSKKINNASLAHPPVFILGHWRSGTTLLHNILARDQRFCYPTMQYVYTPNAFLTANKIFRQVARFIKVKNRIIDEMSIGPDSPQEDEFVLGNLGHLASYHGFYFPQNFEVFFDKYMTLDGMNPEEIILWKELLLNFYIKLSFVFGDKQILSKNPIHTARIKYLLELFPDAKFIHIYRNPYTVYLSTINTFNKLIKQFSLQKHQLNLEAQVFIIYKRLMAAFFEQKNLIPSGNFTEIRFENLERNPLVELEKIYLDLGLIGFSQVKNQFVTYLDTLKGYKKNHFSLTPVMADQIYKNLSFTIDRWGYKDPFSSATEFHS